MPTSRAAAAPTEGVATASPTSHTASFPAGAAAAAPRATHANTHANTNTNNNNNNNNAAAKHLMSETVALLKEIQRKVDSASQPYPELRQTLQWAIAAVKTHHQQAAAAEEAKLSPAIAADVVPSLWHSSFIWSMVLSCFFWKRKKLIEPALHVLMMLLRCPPSSLDLRTTLFFHLSAPSGSGGGMGGGNFATAVNGSMLISTSGPNNTSIITNTSIDMDSSSLLGLNNSSPSSPSGTATGSSPFGGPMSIGGNGGGSFQGGHPNNASMTGGGGGGNNNYNNNGAAGPIHVLSVPAGEAVYHALVEALVSVTDTSILQRLLALLERYVASPKGRAYFAGRATTRVLNGLLHVALQSSQEVLQQGSQHVLYLSVQTIVGTFVAESKRRPPLTQPKRQATTGGEKDKDKEKAEAPSASYIFATTTMLDDYTLEVEHEAPYIAVEVSSSAASLVRPHGRSFAAAKAPALLSSREASNVLLSSRNPSFASVPMLDQLGQPSLVTDVPTDSAAAGGGGGDGRSPVAALIGPYTYSNTTAKNNPSATYATNTVFSPHMLYDKTVEEWATDTVLAVMQAEESPQLPAPLRDLILLVRFCCRVAARPCAGSPNENNTEVRARLLGLHMLESLFTELPVANCLAEHLCAPWLHLVLVACQRDLFSCLSRNIAAAAPFAFFDAAVQITGKLLRKCHYTLSRELHSFLAVFLLPLASSPCSSFRQKHAVLSMIHDLFSVPHLIISYFVNYDCNPAFDADGRAGGMLELLCDFVIEMTFAAVDADDNAGLDGDGSWLNSDQQQLLRSECVVALHTIVSSLHQWVAEDPKVYALRYLNLQRHAGTGAAVTAAAGAAKAGAALSGAKGNTSKGDKFRAEAGKTGGDNSHWAEVYLDNWSTSSSSAASEAGDDAASGRPMHPAGSTISMDSDFSPVFFTLAGHENVPMPLWGKNRNIFFHWKHIHCLLHNKRVAQEGLQMINSGKWKEAKQYLEAKRYIPRAVPSEQEQQGGEEAAKVEPGTSSYRHFARFLMEYPGVERGALSAIFDRVNKPDPANKLVLKEYLHLFHYANVPIDLAMRDTTCEFISWDRPMFEAQVWETIQSLFGEEYARQNPEVITAKDADTMAGVLLFLHSNLHNESARSSRMVCDQFVSDANACLDFPFCENDMREMFERVSKNKWALDESGRTPKEVLNASNATRFSHRVLQERWKREWALAEEAASKAREDRSSSSSAAAATEKVTAAGRAETHMDPMAMTDAPLTPPSAQQEQEQEQPASDDHADEKVKEEEDHHAGDEEEEEEKEAAAEAQSAPSSPTGDVDMMPPVKRESNILAEVDSDVLNEVRAAAAAAAEGEANTTTSDTTSDKGNNHNKSGDRKSAAYKTVGNTSKACIPQQQPPGQKRPTPTGVTPAPTTAAVPASNKGVSPMMSRDLLLFDNPGAMKGCYTSHPDTFKLREEHNQVYTHIAEVALQKLEAAHQKLYAERSSYHMQPYVLAHYAEHVRPLLLHLYAPVMASLYLGFRVLEESPLANQLLETIYILYDLAGAFVLNMGDLREEVERTLQRYLEGDHTYRLTPPTRGTFVPFLMNMI